MAWSWFLLGPVFWALGTYLHIVAQWLIFELTLDFSIGFSLSFNIYSKTPLVFSLSLSRQELSSNRLVETNLDSLTCWPLNWKCIINCSKFHAMIPKAFSHYKPNTASHPARSNTNIYSKNTKPWILTLTFCLFTFLT